MRTTGAFQYAGWLKIIHRLFFSQYLNNLPSWQNVIPVLRQAGNVGGKLFQT
jgi:hypothetical protein